MISIENVEHQYNKKTVLSLEKWEIEATSQWLLLGASGSGKTSLLHILGGLLRPSKGDVWMDDTDITVLKGAQLDKFRAKNIGLIFQKPHLVKTLTVFKNLQLAQYAAGISRNKKRCEEVLEALRLTDRKNAYPSQLSGGEAQRVSVARALLNEPQLLLADEPTANLDDENADQVIQLIKKQAETNQATLIIATHDQRVKNHFELVQELPKLN